MTTTPGAYQNPYGWDTPYTDALLDISPYSPLDPPEENLAERLMMLGHLLYNTQKWQGNFNYWEAFRARTLFASHCDSLAEFWGRFTGERGMMCKPIRRIDMLHEKNLMCHPMKLPNTPVDDLQVLRVFNRQSNDLRDRVRMWATVRRNLPKAHLQATDPTVDTLADTTVEDPNTPATQDQ